MRIALVSEHANPLASPGSIDSGGQNVHVAALARALAARGHRVIVYTRRDDPHTPARVPFAHNVDVVHVAAGPAMRLPKDGLLPYMGDFARELASAWSVERPDVVHSHFWMSGLAALEAAACFTPTLPVVHTYHALGTVKRRFQGAADTSPATRENIETMIGQQAAAIIATCPDEVHELSLMGVPGGHVDVVPCGVDSSLFTAEGTAETRGAAFRLVSIGRLVPRKGVDLVITALAQLAQTGHYDVELEIVGAGEGDTSLDPEVLRLKQLATDLGVTERVHFRDRLEQHRVPALMRSADAVVCTPWYEPFGIVPLEAMSCGTPVIVAALGGLQESVLDAVTGFHVPPRDPQAVAAAAAQIFDDPQLRQALGVAGRLRVAARYTWASVAERTEATYDRVLTRAGHDHWQYEGATA